MKHLFAGVLAVGIGAVFAGQAQAQQPPQSGSYLVDSVVTGVEGNCVDRVNQTGGGIAAYMGPSGKTLDYHSAFTTGIQHVTLTIASGLGKTAQSGTFVIQFPGASPQRGSFQINFVYLDSHSFEASIVGETTTGCTEALNLFFIRTS